MVEQPTGYGRPDEPGMIVEIGTSATLAVADVPVSVIVLDQLG